MSEIYSDSVRGQDPVHILHIPCIPHSSYLLPYFPLISWFDIKLCPIADQNNQVEQNPSNPKEANGQRCPNNVRIHEGDKHIGRIGSGFVSSAPLPTAHSSKPSSVVPPKVDKSKLSHDDMIMLSDHIDAARAYYRKSKQICEDPVERQKYFPQPTAVRRVRTWAGSSIPHAHKAALRLNAELPSTMSIHRPFRDFQISKESFLVILYQEQE